VNEFPTCYVEETPCPEDFATTLEPQATEPETQARSDLKGKPAKEFPICYVEEIPWLGDYNPTRHAKKVMSDDEARNSACTEMNVDEAKTGMNVEVAKARMNMEVGNETFNKAINNDLHSPLLCAEHPTLVFELQGHMTNYEHRAIIMG
jgi:hypothetical protein